MNLVEAQNWISAHAAIEQGYYLDGDNGQPNPAVVYCRKHADAMARRLTRKLRVRHCFCEAWAGSDIVEWCGIKTCGVTLYTGGLTDYGIRTTLGLDEANPISFVADINELEMVQRALSGTSNSLVNQYHWQLWLSQVLRNQRGVTKKQCLAFEAAWLADQWNFALDILRQKSGARKRGRKAA